MIGRNIVVIGASTGGIDAVRQLIRQLPPAFNAAVFVAMHIGAVESRLAQMLARASKLPVSEARDGEIVRAGHVYVAAPDRHLILERGRMRLVRGPKENFTRPAIDPLFRSAAIAYGNRVVGIILTGMLGDGAAGLLAIKDRGGIAIVQDPEEARAPSMPRAALARVPVDHCCRIDDMPALLLHYDPPDLPVPAPAELLRVEHAMTAQEARRHAWEELERLATPTAMTCPDCRGVLYELRDDRLLRFRCGVGHAMAAFPLLARLAAEREDMMWSLARTMEEEAWLAAKLKTRDEGAAVADDPDGAGSGMLNVWASALRTMIESDSPGAAAWAQSSDQATSTNTGSDKASP